MSGNAGLNGNQNHSSKDVPSTKIFHPPGGKSNFSFGDSSEDNTTNNNARRRGSKTDDMADATKAVAPLPLGQAVSKPTDYKEPVEAPLSSRVQQPPGGRSSFTLG